MLTHTTVQLLLAQAIVERGLLDSIAAGLGNARYRLELYVGQGNTIYVVIAVVVLLFLTRVRRRH
jgi:hypothetical protein